MSIDKKYPPKVRLFFPPKVRLFQVSVEHWPEVDAIHDAETIPIGDTEYLSLEEHNALLDAKDEIIETLKREFKYADFKEFADTIEACLVEEKAKYAALEKDCKHWKVQFDIGIQVTEKLEAKLSEAEAALEFYAAGKHFQYDGGREFEPEVPSGEPENWLCGGAEGGEFTYEDGTLASSALAKLRGENDLRS